MKSKGLKKFLPIALAMAVLTACGTPTDSSNPSVGEQETKTQVESVMDETIVAQSTQNVEEIESKENTSIDHTEKTKESSGAKEEPTTTKEAGEEESVEATEESKESLEATGESVEASQESVAPSKEQESTKPSKEESKPSPEQTTSGQEASKPSPEQTTPGQEASKPSTEQTTPGQEAAKPSTEQTTPGQEASKPSQEQPRPSAPPVHTCDYGSGSVTKAATCKEEGVKTYTCSCGKTRTESIPVTAHSYVTESQAATCSAEGYERTKCSACGDVKSETVLGKTDHSYYETWFLEPDCTYPGSWHYMRCHNCDYQQELPLGALGHMPDAGTVIHPGTCDDRALIAHNCTRCGCTMEDTYGDYDPNNHDWGYDQEEEIWYCAACGITK